MKRPPIRFELEVKVASGEEGQELRVAQARAIKDILMWWWRQQQGTSA